MRMPVRTGLEFLDEQLVGVRDRYEEARKSEDISTTKALASVRRPCLSRLSFFTYAAFSGSAL
jgi:hypothetical protein